MIGVQGLIAQLTEKETNEKLRQILASLASTVDSLLLRLEEVEGRSIPDLNLTYTPIQITANQNDYAQPETPGIWRLSANPASDITGIAYSNDGELIRIVNVGSRTITLKHQNAGSRAENRMICTGAVDIALGTDEAAIGWYDEITLRWRMFKL